MGGAYPTEDPFACHFADSVINTFTDFEQRSPKQDNGKPLMYKMFGPDKISEEDVTKMVDARKGLYEAMEKLLGDKTFFGGDKPSIADFWLCASIYSWERNRKGNTSPRLCRTRRRSQRKCSFEQMGGHNGRRTQGISCQPTFR